MQATTKFRLFCGRDCDGMIRKLEDATINNKAVSCLEIRETALEDDVVDSIVDLLSKGSVTTIHLEDCSAHLNNSVLRLVEALGNCRDVRLSESTFLSKFFLETFLESAKQLQNLRIRDHLLVDQVEALSRGLASNKFLHTLDLSRSRIDDFSVLAEGLKVGCAKRLKLRSIGLRDQHLAILVEALKSSSLHPKTTLESLDLSFNRLRNLKCIGYFLKHQDCQLKELLIGYQNLWQPNRSGTKNIDVSEIATSLTLINSDGSDSGTKLTTLKLPRNELTDSDALLLATALQSENSALEVLDLRENDISDNGALALAESARWSKRLRQLHLRGNPFGTLASRSLLLAASSNFHLAILGDNGRREDEEIHRKIRYHTALNRGGRWLLLQDERANFSPLSSLPPSLALWPLVLEKQASRLDGEGMDDKPLTSDRLEEESLCIDVIYYLLKSSPMIFDLSSRTATMVNVGSIGCVDVPERNAL